MQQELKRLRSKKEDTPKPGKLSIEKLELERKKLELERYQTADLPLLKFKVATITKHGYSLLKPNQRWLFVGCGVAFGLFISIIIAFLIDLQQLRAKEISSASK